MKNKIIVIIILCLIMLIGLYFGIKYINNREIPDNYIAVFHGGAGERLVSTYIYKIDNGHANYGFKYINTVSMTESWGSSNYQEKITDRGKVDWTDNVFSAAQKNGAYDYVRLPNDTRRYTIAEFMGMFMMN